MKNATQLEQRSERELVIERTFDAPARLLFAAWTRPELLQRWWAPRSTGMAMLSCEADVRAGGEYRFVFGLGGAAPMAFHGRYLEVIPDARLVWTNEEGAGEGPITTVTFEEIAGKTRVTVRELHPSKEACEAARGSGMEAGTIESFGQLDELLIALAAEGQPPALR